MGKVVDALIDGTPLGKLVWDAIGVDAWWEIGVGKYVREALIPIPDDDFGNEAMSQQQMLRSPTEARRSIYGKAMVSGPIVFAAETGTDNEYLHLVIPLAAHQCADVLEIYFDDEVVYQNGSLDTAYSKHARINIHLGTQTAADSDLLAECEHWTASHIGLGITYLYVRLKHDPEFYANGLPNIKALVQGKPLYDPRKDSTVGGSGSHRWDDESSWEWSDNWALCVLDYTRFESGVGALVNEIDLPSYALAANDSDQLVEYDDEGNTEKRYTCNGTFTQSMTPASVLDKLLTAGAGMQTYSSGKYQLFSGVYQGPHLLTIGEADLAGEVEVRPFNARAQLCNAVRGTFVDPDNFYQPTDFAPYESDYYRAQDNGEYIDHDIDLPFTQSAYTAQRLAKLHLELNRAGQQIVAPLNMIGLSVSVGQVVELDLPRLGIKAEYQVMDWQFDFGQPIKVTLRETGPALFDYDKGSYTDRKLTPVLTLPSSKRVPTVTGVLWTPMGDDANWQGLLAWNAPGGNSAYRYRLEVSNGLNVVVYQATIDGTRHHIPKLDAGNYTITLWAVNLFANRSNVPATIAIGADAPPAVTGILVDTGVLELTLRPQTAVSTATSTVFNVKGGLSNNVANAEPIGTGKTVVWTGRTADTTYYLWAQTVNDFGISEWYGPVQTKTSGDNATLLDALAQSITESQLGQALLSKITLATEAGSSMADALAAAHKSIDDAKQQLLLAQSDISISQRDRVAANAKIGLLEEARTLIDSRLGDLDDQVGSIGTRVTNVETENEGTAERLTAVEASSEDSASRVASLEQASDDQALLIDDLETVTDDNSSRLTTAEQTTAAQAQSLTQLQTQQNAQGASIATLQQTTSDQALELQQIEAEQGNQSSSINTLQQASSDQALQISELETESYDQDSRISSVEQTTASQAISINQLQTESENQSSSITALTKTDAYAAERAAQLQVEKDNAAAEMVVQELVTAKEVRRTASLSVRADESESNIADLQQVTATTAQTVEQLSSSTNENTAAIEETSQTLADLDGNVSALKTIKAQTTSNGKTVMAGMVLGSDGETSEALFYAQRFGVINENADGSIVVPFIIENGQVVMANAMIATLLNKTIIQRTGGSLQVFGVGFGSSNQFLEWFGPDVGDISNCTEANAASYRKVDGSAYFGGAITTGDYKNAVTSSQLSSTAAVETAFGSEGGIITIAVSLQCHGSFYLNQTGISSSGTTSGTVVLERSLDVGETWSVVQTISCGGSWSISQEGIDRLGSSNLSGSATFTDSDQTTATRYYRARVTSYNAGSVPFTTQRLSLIATENT
ncbi:phage tail tip fiber protein [Shewanella algae]|uniref:phage tail tip fiber protein n=1 Tax=Shewanella algae TaxID=38313 RepID=UPI001C5627C7|nr:DUF1983 domain-containing protein [Shewanella algae]